MDELVARIVATVGIDRPIAERAVGIILDFLATEGPPENVQNLFAHLPGSAEAAAAAHGDNGGGGMLGGIMAVGSRLMAAGLGMGEIQGVTHELIAFAREKAGGDDVDAVVAAIPGLGQFV
jgi:hypothetical protein